MKAFKVIVLFIGSLAALFLLIAFFLPKTFTLEKSILIQAPADSVFAYVADLKHRSEWDPWLAVEPEAQTIVFGRGEGARWEWEGTVIGKGRLTIKQITPGKSILSHVTFLSPQTGEADISWRFDASENVTKVTWGFSMPLTYPFNRYGGLFMEKYLAPFYIRGLAKIKTILETPPQAEIAPKNPMPSF